MSRRIRAAGLGVAGLLAAGLLCASARAETPVAAAPAGAFVDSIGVNTHLNSAWDTAYSYCANGSSGATHDCPPATARIAAALRFAGIRHIRDAFGKIYINDRLRQLSTEVPGLRALFLVGGDRDGTIADQLDAAVAAGTVGLFTALEGPNEPNNPPMRFSYRGKLFPDGARAAMRDLRAAMRGGPFDHLPLVNTALGGGSPDDYGTLGNIAEADLASSHAYYGTEPAGDFTKGLTPSRTIARGKPMVITETGNCTTTAKESWCGVTEPVQAKYTLIALADAFRLGVVRTYLYELVDEQPDPDGLDVERHFGLFHTDWSPKPVAEALHRLTTAMGEGGCAGRLAYSLDNAKSLLLRRADGHYLVLAWTEPMLWVRGRGGEAAVPPHPEELHLPPSRAGGDLLPGAVQLLDPVSGQTATLSPRGDGATGQERVLGMVLPDHPVLIDIPAKSCARAR